MKLSKLVLVAILALSSAASIAQEKRVSVLCFTVTSPGACEWINEFPGFAAKFRKVFPPGYGIYVNSGLSTGGKPLKQNFLYGVIEVVKVSKTSGVPMWTPIYALPFFDRRDEDPTKWMNKEERDREVGMIAVDQIVSKLESGELKP